MTHGLRRVCIRLSACAALLTALVGCAGGPQSSSDTALGFGSTDTPDTLAVSATTRGELGRAAPVNPRDGSHYRVYNIDLEADTLMLLSGRSDDFGPTLTLYAPDGTHLGNVSSVDDWGYQADEARLIRRTVSAGRYTLVVSAHQSGETGAFEIEALPLQEDASLEVPGAASGYLATSGGRQHPYTGARMRAYPFTLDSAVTLDIRLESEDFDAYLTLVEAGSEEVLAENDDWGMSTDSRIMMELEPGDYELWATGLYSESAGLFTLSARERVIEDQELATFGADGLLSDVMTDNRQPVPGTSGTTGNPHAFSVEEPIVLDLQMISSDLDAYLFVTDPEGVIVGEDDDSAGSLNARLLMPLEPGEYTIWASSFSESGRGDYQLLTEVHQPEDFEGTFIGDYILGDPVRGDELGGSPGCGCGYDW